MEVQRDRLSRQKENEESDRTINYQKQVLDNKKAAEELKAKVEVLSAENAKLKAEVERYKGYYNELQEKEIIILEKDGIIGEMSTKIFTQKQELDKLRENKEALKQIEIEKVQL